MSNQLVRVALVFGGVSSEHEISCLTAGGVARAIDPERFDVVGIGITREGDWVRIDHEELTSYEVVGSELPQVAADRPRAVLVTARPRARRGRFGLLDSVRRRRLRAAARAVRRGRTIRGRSRCRACDTWAGVAAARSGWTNLMKRSMAAAGLPVGPWEAVTPAQWRDDREESLARVNRLTYPVFVKPARGGSSLGIVRVESPEGLAAAIEEARRFDPKVVVEQGFVGMREIELGVIENPTGPPRVSLPGEILMHTPDAFYDFDAKYLPEEQVSLEVPAEVDEDLRAALQELAARTFSAMAVEGLARMELFVDASGVPWVNELNNIPGFTRLNVPDAVGRVRRGLPRDRHPGATRAAPSAGPAMTVGTPAR